MSSLILWDFLIGKIARKLPVPFNLKRWKLRKIIENKIREAVQVRRKQLASTYKFFRIFFEFSAVILVKLRIC
jgi:hypothetical protein